MITPVITLVLLSALGAPLSPPAVQAAAAPGLVQAADDGTSRPAAVAPSASAEDPLPPGAVARLGSHRLRHDGYITGLAWWPDGSELFTIGSEGTLRRWSPDTGASLSAPRTLGAVPQSLSVSPDGTRIATGHRDGTVRLVDLTRSGEPEVLDLIATSVAFAPDGARLATRLASRLATWISASPAEFVGEPLGITVLDAAGRERLGRFELPLVMIAEVVFTPDGGELAVIGSAQLPGRQKQDGRVLVLDADSGATLLDVDIELTLLTCLVAPVGEARLFVGAGDGRILELDRTTGEQRHGWKAHDSTVTCLAASADGTRLASAGQDGRVQLWSRGGELLRAFDLAPGPRVLDLGFSPDGRVLAAACSDRVTRLWDVGTGAERLPATGHRATISSVTVTPDGAALVTGGYDARVCVWDPATGEMLRSLPGHLGYVLDVACSPDGQRLASVGEESSLHLWELAGGDLTGRGEPRGGVMTSVAFAPDGRTVATGSLDSSVCTWDVESLEQGLVLDAGGLVHCVAYSPDGGRLFAGTSDVLIWDARTGQALGRLDGTSPIQALVVSGDGTLLATASADRRVRLYHLASGELRLETAASAGRVTSLALSPDGTLLASGALNESTVRLWDARTGAQLREFAGHHEPVLDLVFSPDGTRLTSVSIDALGLVWAVPPRD